MKTSLRVDLSSVKDEHRYAQDRSGIAHNRLGAQKEKKGLWFVDINKSLNSKRITKGEELLANKKFIA